MDGLNLVQLTFFGGPLTGTPSWGPDGYNLVFDSRLPDAAALFTITYDGGPPHKLTTDTREACRPNWSKDGKWIYFSGESVPGIWKTPAAGGASIELTADFGYDIRESVDGSHVLYVHHDKLTGILELRSVSVEGPASASGRPLTTLRSFGQWSPAPDGYYVADGLSFPATIDFVDLASGTHHKVMDLSASFQSNIAMDATPDGRTLVYARVDQVNSDITLVDHFP